MNRGRLQHSVGVFRGVRQLERNIVGVVIASFESSGNVGSEPVDQPAAVVDCLGDAGNSLLKLSDRSLSPPDSDRSDKVQWKSAGNGSTSFESLGPIFGASDLRLCVYDTTAGIASARVGLAVAGGGSCKARACWKRGGPSAAPSGYKYRNNAGNPDGIRTVKIKKVDSSPQIFVKGIGSGLDLPGPFSSTAYFDENPSVVAQLQTTAGVCWQASYSATSSAKNTDKRFHGRCTGCP